MLKNKFFIGQSPKIKIGESPFFIAGLCSIEDEETTLNVASIIKDLSIKKNIPIIFKACFSKASRTKHTAYHGPGIDKGLEILKEVKNRYNLLITSDVYETQDVSKVADVLDIIQIPSLLCKITPLLYSAAETGKPINIKKGQFMTPQDMIHSVEKIVSRGNEKVILTERGNIFGYDNSIADFRSIEIMQSFGFPVLFDVTHSVRIMSRRSNTIEGATPEYIPLLTRCAGAAGADGLFIETHTTPSEALCDSAACFPISDLDKLFSDFERHWKACQESFFILEKNDHFKK